MALLGFDRGSASSGSAGTSFTLSPNADFTAGSMAVLAVSADNANTSGTAFGTFSVSDTLGNTWTRRTSPLYDPGAASAGVEGGIFTCAQDKGTLTTGTTITVSFGAISVTAKSWTLTEVKADGGSPSYVTGANGTGSGTASPTVTTSSIPQGDFVFGAVFSENTTSSADPWVGDADTTNGSWSTAVHTGQGAALTGMSMVSQYKTVTADGTQTYNPTASVGTPDCIASWIRITETRVNQDGTPSDRPFATTLQAHAQGVRANIPAGLKSEVGRPGPALRALHRFVGFDFSDRVAISNTNVTPDVGVVVVSGLAPTVVQEANIVAQPSVGAVVVAGLAPTVVQEANVFAQPDTGAVVVAGLAPTFVRTEDVLAQTDVGAAVITGLAPTATQEVIGLVAQPDVGTVVVAGQAPTLSTSATAQPSVGSVVVAGQAPTLVSGTVLEPDVGAVVVAGQAPALVSGAVTQPSAGTVVVAGQAPTSAVSDLVTVSPAQGTVVVSGQAPTAISSAVAQPSAGSIVVAGAAPTVAVSDLIVVAPAQGAVVVDGQTPTLVRGTIVRPEASLDDFNRADGSLGSNWTTVTSMDPLAVAGNECIGTNSGSHNVAYWSANSFDDDQFSEMTVGAAAVGPGTTYWGPVVRAQVGAQSFYVMYVNNSAVGVTIYRWQAGSATQIDGGGVAPTVATPGDVLRLEIVGNALTAYVNGVARATATDSTFASGYPGINIFRDGTADNWTGGPTVTAVVAQGRAPVAARTENVLADPARGSIVIAGQTPSVTQTFNVLAQPDAGTVVVTGQPPVAQTGDNQTAQPDAGALVVSGLAPAAARTENVISEPDVGAIVIAGATPSLTQTENVVSTPTQGAIVVSGLAPSVTADNNVLAQPDVGALVVSGLAPDAARTENVLAQPDAGAIVISGAAPTLAQTENVVSTPAQGAVVIDGLAPAVQAGDNVAAQPGAGSIVIEGAQPSVTRTEDVLAVPNAGALVVIGLLPSVSLSTTAQPAAGAIVVSGLAPTCLVAEYAQPGHAELLIVGQGPQIFVTSNAEAKPSAGQIVVSGYAPSVIYGGFQVAWTREANSVIGSELNVRRNVAGQVIGAQLVNKTDGTPVTSGSTEVYVTGDGGTAALGTGTVSGLAVHEGNGFWSYTPAQSETDYEHIAFTFVNASAVTASPQVYTVVDPWDSTLEGSYTAGEIMRILAAIAAGKTDIANLGNSQATVTFRDITDSSDIVSASMSGSERTSVNITP